MLAVEKSVVRERAAHLSCSCFLFLFFLFFIFLLDLSHSCHPPAIPAGLFIYRFLLWFPTLHRQRPPIPTTSIRSSPRSRFTPRPSRSPNNTGYPSCCCIYSIRLLA